MSKQIHKYIYLCCKSCILNFNDGPYRMKRVAFIGDIIKDFFSKVMYMPIFKCHKPAG